LRVEGTGDLQNAIHAVPSACSAVSVEGDNGSSHGSAARIYRSAGGACQWLSLFATEEQAWNP